MVSVVGVLIDCCSCGVADSTLLFLLFLRGAGGRDCFDYLPVVFSRCWDCSLSVCLSAISTGLVSTPVLLQVAGVVTFHS